MRTFGSELGWALVIELVLPVGIVMVTPVASPLEDLIRILLGLKLGNSFVT